jgi:hypothetical protein
MILVLVLSGPLLLLSGVSTDGIRERGSPRAPAEAAHHHVIAGFIISNASGSSSGRLILGQFGTTLGCFSDQLGALTTSRMTDLIYR